MKNGVPSGETHISLSIPGSGETIFSHPIDVQFEVFSAEGWPTLVCEVYSSLNVNNTLFYIRYGIDLMME